MAITGIVLGGLGVTLVPLALMISILLPALNRAREVANRVKCANNMRQIGLAMELYKNDNHGAYPPDLGILTKTEDLAASVFACPSAPTVVPSGLSADQTADWVDTNSDYIYTGSGLSGTLDPAYILLYEKDADHRDGMNLLYGDGHVEFCQLPAAHDRINADSRLRPGQ
jgi:prepilin-type processing-associated H-X9-DG protein